MRIPFVLLGILIVSCSSSVTETSSTADPQVVFRGVSGCYRVQTEGPVAADVSLPTLIELSDEPAPLFVDPGPRLAVKEPGTRQAKASISWWAPQVHSTWSLAVVTPGTASRFNPRAEEDGLVGDRTSPTSAWIQRPLPCHYVSPHCAARRMLPDA